MKAATSGEAEAGAFDAVAAGAAGLAAGFVAVVELG
jgi:hypothetical protein